MLPVPRIIDFEQVLRRMEADGFRSLYHNSGAFGFARGVTPLYAGWVGPPDESIRAEMRQHVRQIPPPYETNLAQMASKAWTTHLGGVAWLMPISHWSYELDFGSRDWMPAALDAAAVDGDDLSSRANGAALEFFPSECAAMQALVAQLLGRLRASDFMLAFPGRPALCTVHHHKQLWWQTTDRALHAALLDTAA